MSALNRLPFKILKAVAYRSLSMAARIPVLQEPLFALYRRTFPNRAWMATHPFDQRLGVDTSGLIPSWLLQRGLRPNRHGVFYVGSHPTCVRAALATIPNPSLYTFVDVGCGKGRPLIVASEFPFRRIVGIELSDGLVRIAARNAAVIAAAFPGRTAIEAQGGDVIRTDLPLGPKAVFVYHAFGREVLSAVVDRLVREVAASGEDIFFAYENPVFFDILDSAPGFTRWFAAQIPCEPEERGFTAEDSEAVIVWRAGSLERTPHTGADAVPRVKIEGWLVGVS